MRPTAYLIAAWLRSKTPEEREALRELDLSGSGDLTDADLVAVADAVADMLPQLSSLNLRSCKQITDAGVIALSQGCPQLSTLDLSNCKQITDAGVIALSQGCRQLSSLKLWGCKQITDAGVSAVREACPNIKIFKLKYHAK